MLTLSKVVFKGLYKVFGPNPRKAIELLNKGAEKDEIKARTNHTVGIANVNLEIEEGEIFVVMGLSGSGKSTLVRCVNRLIEPTTGQVFIDGEDVTAMSPSQLRSLRQNKMAMVFQRFGLLPNRNVIDNVAFGLEIKGLDRKARYEKARQALETVGLAGYEDSHVDQLSGGMQQRVGLARALSLEPEILLMDEPFSALDPLIRRDMQDELLDLQERLHKTIVFITHDLDEALKLGNRIAVMKDGIVVQVGSPEEILKNPANEYVADFTRDIDRSQILTARDVMRKPDAIVNVGVGPRVALREMDREGLSSVFVVGPDRHLEGLVTADDALAAADRKDTDIASILRHDFETVGPRTPLAELLAPASQAKFPIAVIDEESRLLGIITRVSVLRGLMGATAGEVRQ